MLQIVKEVRRFFSTRPRQTSVTVRSSITRIVKKYISRHPEYRPADYFPYIVKYMLGHVKQVVDEPEEPEQPEEPQQPEVIEEVVEPEQEPEQPQVEEIIEEPQEPLVEEIEEPQAPVVEEIEQPQEPVVEEVSGPEIVEPAVMPAIVRPIVEPYEPEPRVSRRTKITVIKKVTKIVKKYHVSEPRQDAPRGLQPFEILEIVRAIKRYFTTHPRSVTTSSVRVTIIKIIRQFVYKHSEYSPQDYYPYVVKYLLGHVRPAVIRPATRIVKRYTKITKIIKQLRVSEPRGNAPRGTQPWEMLEIVREVQKYFRSYPRQTTSSVRITIIRIIKKYIYRHPGMTANDYFPYIVKYLLGHITKRIVVPAGRRPSTTSQVVSYYSQFTSIVQQFGVSEPRDNAPRGCQPWEMLEIVREVRKYFKSVTTSISSSSVRVTIIKIIRRYIYRHAEYSPEDYFPYIVKYLLNHVSRRIIRPATRIVKSYTKITKIVQKYRVTEPRRNAPRGCSSTEMIEIVREVQSYFRRYPSQTFSSVRVTIIRIIKKYIYKHPEYTAMDYFPYIVKYLLGHVSLMETRPSTSSTTTVSVYKKVTSIVQQYGVSEPRDNAPRGCQPWEMLEIVREIRRYFKSVTTSITSTSVRVTIIKIIRRYIYKHSELSLIHI